MILLKEDIKSNFHKDGKERLYGRKNELVVQVADHGDVLIVQNKTGEKFPVHKDFLIIK